MSDSTTSALANFNFTGGIPSSKDFVPSIIFLALYILVVPLYIVAAKKNQLGFKIMIRPALFIVARLAFFGIRIYLAKHTITQGLLEADLILVLVGYVFIIEPAVELWKQHTTQHFSGASGDSSNAGLYVLVTRVLRLALLGAIITGIIAGTSISGAIDDPSKISSVKTTRKVCYILSLVVAGVLFIANIYTSMIYKHLLDGRISLMIGINSILLLVIAIYRLANGEANSTTSAISSKALFYILQITLEWIVVIGLLVTIIIFVRPPPTSIDLLNSRSDIENKPTTPNGGFGGGLGGVVGSVLPILAGRSRIIGSMYPNAQVVENSRANYGYPPQQQYPQSQQQYPANYQQPPPLPARSGEAYPSTSYSTQPSAGRY